MFKKIEIWILYLVLIGVFISYIIFGAIVRRDALGRQFPKFIQPLTNSIVFLAKIPSNFRKISKTKKSRFKVKNTDINFDSKGFSGDFNNDEVYLLLSRFDGDINEGVVELIDLRNFKKLHIWRIKKKNLIEKLSKYYDDLNEADLSLFIGLHPIIESDGSLIFNNFDEPLIRININSDISKIFYDNNAKYHHSLESDHEGNYWVPVSYSPYKIDKKYVGAKGYYIDDGIRKVDIEGNILFDKSISELFFENNMKNLLFGLDIKYLNPYDPIHLNDIEPVRNDGSFWKKGDVFLSLRNQSMVLLYRPKTNKIIWKSEGFLSFQHDVDILDDSRISIFNNNTVTPVVGGQFVDGTNEIIIYNFKENKYLSFNHNSMKIENIKTKYQGRSQILPNKSFFVEETNNGRLFYFNPDGSKRWQYINANQSGDLYYLGWSRILYKEDDLQIINNLMTKLEKKTNE